MDSIKNEILLAFDTFWDIWANRDNKENTLDDIIPFFNNSISTIGTGDHELGKDYHEVVQNFKSDFNEFHKPLSINYTYKKAMVLSSTSGYVEAVAIVSFELDDGTPLNLQLRFTTIFVLKNDKWLIAHSHISMPSNDQDIGESFPIDALKAKNNRLQELVTIRTKELEEKSDLLRKEKEKTELLLYNILPRKIARELIAKGKIATVRHENVSVIFTDFMGFTQIASTVSAKKIVKELNEIFFHFDDLIREESLEKIKTIGDSYMAVCGLPEADDKHAYKCVRVAKKMQNFIQNRNKTNDIEWKMRVGIHSGPVVAGIVGKDKFAYDLWGNTVNVASRLETAGLEGKVNISHDTYELLKGDPIFTFESRGKINTKGKGEVEMYFVS
ncbi:adenylate/guanylate cyclase domain-containing protein [Lacinutrix iliipiscaria]|uniref:Adenylate/guanylate cyclase domain-containing protein n=1 Tax=Lacinutrix iliipiscaria TaxID=1230532 RepID=A0ABW5WLV6_9FLAO